jgi:LmbE family N-acetylglucosaminyl deacetylase
MYMIHTRTGLGVYSVASLAEAFGAKTGQERFLFVNPHDDDACVGAGLTIALACDEGFEVHVVIVTDGQGGYCRIEDKPRIIEIRRRETLAAYAMLGVSQERLHFLGFADGSLGQYIGRRPAASGDPALEGYTGLENSLTHLLRTLKPQRVFTPAGTDFHPDHQAVYKEILISLFHASGEIWPELGAPCALPEVYEYPTYVTMDHPPDLMIEADEALFKRKLDAIHCFASQHQIDSVVESIHQAGPVEFNRNIRFSIYHPSIYKPLFREAV